MDKVKELLELLETWASAEQGDSYAIMDNVMALARDIDLSIKVEKKRVYGNDLIYIKSDHAAAINQLTGKLTIDTGNIEALKQLGFVVEVIAPEL